jgi:hypothetical protein
MSKREETNGVQMLQDLWKQSITTLPQPQAQGTFRGFNLRFNLGKALAAVGATAATCTAAAGAAAMNPVALVGLPVSLFAAVSAAIATVYEEMHPLHYVACVVLAGYPNGLTKAELKDNLDSFFTTADPAKYPWYLGLSKELLSNAEQAYQKGQALDDLVKGLKQKKYAQDSNGRLTYAVPDFELGLFPK